MATIWPLHERFALQANAVLVEWASARPVTCLDRLGHFGLLLLVVSVYGFGLTLSWTVCLAGKHCFGWLVHFDRFVLSIHLNVVWSFMWKVFLVDRLARIMLLFIYNVYALLCCCFFITQAEDFIFETSAIWNADLPSCICFISVEYLTVLVNLVTACVVQVTVHHCAQILSAYKWM